MLIRPKRSNKPWRRLKLLDKRSKKMSKQRRIKRILKPYLKVKDKTRKNRLRYKEKKESRMTKMCTKDVKRP